MNPSISRKMDMVKDVFLNNKRLEEHLVSVDDWMFLHDSDINEDDTYYGMQLLMEGKSKKKVSNKKICRIKNNKGEFVDIKKIRNDKKDDSHVLELPSPDGEENLISIGNQMTIPESLRLLEKVKRGKKKFKDFISQKPTFIRRKTEEILY